MSIKTMHSTVRIGDMLVNKGLIDEQTLQEALEEQRRNPYEKLGETLVRMEFIQEEDLLEIIAEQFDIPWLTIDKGLYDPEIFGIIPPEFCERHHPKSLERSCACLFQRGTAGMEVFRI